MHAESTDGIYQHLVLSTVHHFIPMDDAPHYSGRLVTPHHHHPHHMAANTKEWHALEDTFWTSSPLPRRYNPAAQKEGKDPLAEHFTTGLSLRHDMDTTSTAPESQFEKQTFLKHHHSSMTVMARKAGGQISSERGASFWHREGHQGRQDAR